MNSKSISGKEYRIIAVAAAISIAPLISCKPRESTDQGGRQSDEFLDSSQATALALGQWDTLNSTYLNRFFGLIRINLPRCWEPRLGAADYELIDAPPGVSVGPEHFNYVHLLRAVGMETFTSGTDQFQLLVEVRRVRTGLSEQDVISSCHTQILQSLSRRCFLVDGPFRRSPEKLKERTYAVYDLRGRWSGGWLCTQVYHTRIKNHVVSVSWVFSYPDESYYVHELMLDYVQISDE